MQQRCKTPSSIHSKVWLLQFWSCAKSATHLIITNDTDLLKKLPKKKKYTHSNEWGSNLQPQSCKIFFGADSTGVARLTELGGQAGGKGLHQGGKHTRDSRDARPERPIAYRQGVWGPLKAPRSWQILRGLRWLPSSPAMLIYRPKTITVLIWLIKNSIAGIKMCLYRFFVLKVNYSSLNLLLVA